MFAPVYFDHNATTPLDPRVLDAMLPFLREQYGNPSSRHEYGRAARDALDRARMAIAHAFGAHPTEVVLTSGGTEANNLFIKGSAARLGGGALAVGATEHPCVLKPAAQLGRLGWTVHSLAVDALGRLNMAAAQDVLERRPLLVSQMMANNETGVLQPVEALAPLCRSVGALLHVDAVQAAGKQAINFRELNALGVNAITVSAHKLGGPKGVGALIVDKRVDLEPLIAGGGHERGLRSGTENVAANVGFGRACELMGERLAKISASRRLRDRLEAGVMELGATVFGDRDGRLPNTSFFAFRALDGETLVGKLDRAGYAIASGSACSSANPEPSHVLSAMRVAPEWLRGAVRVSLGPDNYEAEVDGFLTALRATLSELDALPRQRVCDEATF